MPECEVTRLQTEKGSSIIAVFVPYKPDFEPKQSVLSYSTAVSPFPESVRRPTILISHGTAVDLGRLVPFYRS